MDRLSVLFYEYVDDIVERRGPHRDQHLAKLRQLKDEGRCVMAGATGEPPTGALIVFSDEQTAEEFVAQDPYVANGLVTAHRIEPWILAVS